MAKLFSILSGTYRVKTRSKNLLFRILKKNMIATVLDDKNIQHIDELCEEKSRIKAKCKTTARISDYIVFSDSTSYNRTSYCVEISSKYQRMQVLFH